ncbi:MAG: S1 RNA-binding domain-containing protein, partial [candidate division KSB1 bacterium]|nr:S1 RNA-binding domain-containing protein [candidate division KSB1 bacterium]
GAFVDIGVKQDGLVHKSQMARRYVKDPLDIVKVGDVIEVKILSVDVERGRIGLSMVLEG